MSSEMSFQTPVVLFIYNRPHFAAAMLKQLRILQPKKLYVVADGPKTEQDAELCMKTRMAFDEVDWECEVKMNYAQDNLGLLLRITSGINWVFEDEDYAIFLEDDCLPSQSFFRFADECLMKYSNDFRIGMISGNSFQFGFPRMETSYTFSPLPRIWGWATWKSRWQKNINSLDKWAKSEYKDHMLRKLFKSPTQRKHWSRQLMTETARNNWDYQWVACNFLEGWLSISPSVNLVSNIGYGDDATHTHSKNALLELPAFEINFPLKHPEEIGLNEFWHKRELWSLRVARLIGKSSVAAHVLHSMLKRG